MNSSTPRRRSTPVAAWLIVLGTVTAIVFVSSVIVSELHSQSSSRPARNSQPEWKVLESLFGQSCKSQDLLDLADHYRLTHFTKGDSGDYFASDQAYCIMYRSGAVSTIVLRPCLSPSIPEFGIYQRPLPGGIVPTDTALTITSKLGPPTTPGGHDWISGDLTLSFILSNKTGQIEQLYISRTNDKTL